MNLDAAMIFAAGLGTRMGHLTENCPKPLIEISGRPLLAYALDLVREAGVSRIVVNIHAHAEKMRDYLRVYAPDVVISHETRLLETGGGLRQALPLLGDGPVFTLNSDMVWQGENPLQMLRNAWNETEMDSLLAVLPVKSAQGYQGRGDFFLAHDKTIARRGVAKQADYVYSGAQIINPNLLQTIEDQAFSLNQVWDQGLKTGRVMGQVYEGAWVDVGRPEGIELAEALQLR